MNFDGVFFDIEDFELTEKVIGEGTFGRVYIVKCIKDGKEYAAKIINFNHKNGFTGKDQKYLMRESTILHDLKHFSIVKFLGINFQSFNNPNKLEPTIITEYLSNGSLKNVLKNESRSLASHKWTATKKYICLLGIANAMKFLHDNGIIHRDLKSENVLLDDDFYPKICDFGLARCFPNSLSNSMSGQTGTPIYMAPELLMEEHSKYGPEIDVYSFAILAYEIVSGKVPYEEFENKITSFGLANKVFNGYRPKFNSNFTEKMKDLISQCWSQKPEERPSFDVIFSKLSSDFSYLIEDVDEDEINLYLEQFKYENFKNPSPKIEKHASASEFFSACEIGNAECVKHFISLATFDVNQLSRSTEGAKSALHIAIEKGNLEIVKQLLKAKDIDVNNRAFYKTSDTKEEKTPLHLSIENGNLEITKLLLENKNININSKAVYDSHKLYAEKTPLHIAAEKGNAEICKQLLAQDKIDVNTKSYNRIISGPYAYYLAKKDENGNMIGHYYEYGSEEKGALHIAVEKENIQIVKLLLASSYIDVNSKVLFTCPSQENLPKIEKTALSIAVEKNNIEIVKLLIEHKYIEINQQYIYYFKYCRGCCKYCSSPYLAMTPMQIAISRGFTDIVKILLANDRIDTNNYANDHFDLKNSLYIAVENKLPEIVQLLINDSRVDVNKKSQIYHTEKNALHLAIENGYTEIVQLLLSNKSIEVNAIESKKDKYSSNTSNHDHDHSDSAKEEVFNEYKDYYEKPPLIIAVEKHNSEVVALLLAHKRIDANITLKTENKKRKDISELIYEKKKEIKTALFIAVENNDKDIVQMLLNTENIDVNFKATIINTVKCNLKKKEYYESFKDDRYKEQLEKLKTEKFTTSEEKRSPLHVAAQKGYVDIVSILLTKKQIDINIMDEKGRKPIDLVEDQKIKELLNK